MNQTIPRFRIGHVLALGLLFFLIMSAFFSIFLWADDAIRQKLSAGELSNGETAEATNTATTAGSAGSSRDITFEPGGDSPLRLPFFLDFSGVIVIIAAALVYTSPARRFFKLKRAGKQVSEPHSIRARKLVLRTPAMVAIVFPLALLVWKLLGLIFSVFVIRDSFMMRAQADMFFLNIILAAMAGLFMYFWQKHRVQQLYLPYLFDEDELTRSLPSSRQMPVKVTLTLVFILATVLPILVTVLLVGSGISIVGGIEALSDDQVSLLLGEPPESDDTGRMGPPDPMMEILRVAGLQQLPILYFSTIDTWRVIAGLFVGFILILAYVFAIMRWTASDFIQPVKNLRLSMRRMSQGENVSPGPVLASNELGELTLGFNTMLRGLEERNRIKGLFGQYLTREVSEAILEGRVNLGGDHYVATIMFTDIRDFTHMSENMQPEEIFAFLNEYLDSMIEVIMAHGGFIDKFIGDGILSVFGLPVRRENHATAAVETALGMRDILNRINQKRQKEGKPPIAIGSGIHTGPVIAGNVGNERRTQFTVIGDTVNLASRLEALNKTYASSILLSDSTWKALPDELRFRGGFEQLSAVEIRGKRELLTLYKAG